MQLWNIAGALALGYILKAGQMSDWGFGLILAVILAIAAAIDFVIVPARRRYGP